MKPFTSYAQTGDAQRLEAASEWLLRLREAPDNEAHIMGWLQWCESDPRNQKAYERVEALWRVSGGLAAEVEQGEFRSITAASPFSWHAWRARWRHLGFSLHEHRGVVAMATVVIAVVAGAAAWNLRGLLLWQDVDDHAVVAAPARPVHHAQLSDGSRMQLAAKSTVAVQYTEAERALELQDGEAYFTVEPNPQRPFVVSAGAVRVRAVGTAFNVRRAGERIVVTVAEGSVDVYRQVGGPAGPSPERVRLEAGGEVAWSLSAAQPPVVASVDPGEALAWREGRLEYTDEPLSAVIADFNRYADRPVHITDPRVADLRFSGTLLTNLTGQWLHALPRLFPIAIREQGDHLVIEALYQERTTRVN